MFFGDDFLFRVFSHITSITPLVKLTSSTKGRFRNSGGAQMDDPVPHLNNCNLIVELRQ
jgi:hypothetical protein